MSEIDFLALLKIGNKTWIASLALATTDLAGVAAIPNGETTIMQIAKKSDSKGRLLLGSAFANMTFLVEERAPGEMVLKKSIVVPENEAWLHKNKNAITSLKRGIDQAKHKNFAHDPLAKDEDMSWLDEIEE